MSTRQPETVARLLNRGVIDLAQLHGSEGGDYVDRLRMLTPKPIIQAFRIATVQDVLRAEASAADHILLDAGAGYGHGLRLESAPAASGGPISWPAGWDRRMWQRRSARLHPYAVDVSSGIETDGGKDPGKNGGLCGRSQKGRTRA